MRFRPARLPVERTARGAILYVMFRVALGLWAALSLAADDGTAGAYRRMCAQCHGEDGDGLFYANIVPLAGIAHRYPAQRIGQLSGAFSGRLLKGPDLDRMVAYMGSLRGEKGFAQPGWIASPYFVEMKSPRTGEVRVLDARPAPAFEAAHVPNAAHVPPGPCIEPPEATARWMTALGIGRETLVLVADEWGGPEAACVWWKLRRAGHAYTAVIDGGMRRYIAENRLTAGSGATVVDAITSPRPGAQWPWRDAVAERGFLPHGKLEALAAARGFAPGSSAAWSGTEPELAHLMLTLALLGHGATYQANPPSVSIAAPVR